MKTFRRTRDVIEWLKDLHRAMAQAYERHRAHTPDKQAQWILDDLHRRHVRFSEVLSDLGDEVAPGVLDTYFQYVPQENEIPAFDSDAIEPQMQAQDAVRAVVEMENRFADLYDRLAEVSDYQEVARIFKDVAANIRSQRDRIVLSGQQIQDM